MRQRYKVKEKKKEKKKEAKQKQKKVGGYILHFIRRSKYIDRTFVTLATLC